MGKNVEENKHPNQNRSKKMLTIANESHSHQNIMRVAIFVVVAGKSNNKIISIILQTNRYL